MPPGILLTEPEKMDILAVNEVIFMHKQDFLYYLKRFLPPAILILLGLILTFSPDSATTLLIQIIGWVLIAAAVGLGLSAVGIPGGLVSKVIGAVIFGVAGIWMVTRPLSLAAWFGRLIGILLLIQGIQDIIYTRSRMGSIFLPLLTAVVGTVLVVLPMTTSRLVFTGIGIVVLIIGVVMLVDRLRHRECLDEPDDPNIIDAL